jgi:hypothetical protein
MQTCARTGRGNPGAPNAQIQGLEPRSVVLGTSGQKCPKRHISAHIHAYRRRRPPIAPPGNLL